MLKKFAFSLILVIFIFGLVLLLPKNLKELPTSVKLSPPATETTIILTGDIMLGRSVMTASLSKKDPTYPFKNVAEVLQKADLVFGNLESPIIESCPSTNSGMIFCASPEMLAGLKFAGIDIVSLANNHTKNYGEEGLTQTENFLTNGGVNFVGAENLVTKEANGIKFGFLGFNFVDTKPTSADYQLVKDSRQKVDVLISMVHWGAEYTSSASAQQKEIANNLIKNGTDVVVGSHPHWVQEIGSIDGKPVFYSLGNFVFDQGWSEETKKGLLILLTYQNDRLSKIEELPIFMENLAQPKFIE
jgi:poly-gamma-glutamate capsule biosynthesis protein CapA/YwtB (metallophosphatase superfamily)